MTDSRSELEPFDNDRIKVTGFYSHSTQHNGKWTSLLQDCQAHADGRVIPFGHAWVQHSNAIRNAAPTPGAKVEFTARVRGYRKRLDAPERDGLMWTRCYGLEYPDLVTVSETTRPTTPAAPPKPPASPLVPGTVRRVKELSAKCPGLKSVLPHLAEINAVAGEVGLGQLTDLLDLFE